MDFFTTYNRPPMKVSPVFPVIKQKFHFVINEDTGAKELAFESEYNFVDEIQAFKDECNIYNIIRRYEYGDTSVLHQVSGVYYDTLGQPKTLMEAMNLSLKIKSDFNSLKPEVRASFNNDFNVFLKSVSDGSVKDILKKFETSSISTSNLKESEVTSTNE